MRKPSRPMAVVFVLSLAVTLLGPVAAAGAIEPPVLLGLYANSGFPGGDAEVQAINGWLGDPTKHISILGTFIDFERPNPGAPQWSIPVELESMWQAGGVPFVNLMVGRVTPTRTMAQVAQGAIDAQITAWADAFKAWATGGVPGAPGPRRAFIAPFQEMNGFWVSYGKDATNFKLAWARVRQIFADRGVPAGSISWVFAPNGWSEPGHEFERYYPGNATVDVVSFSAYNYGTCSPYSTWDTYAGTIRPHLERMRAMAPAKPIFIAETGTVAQGGDKNVWLDETFSQLAAFPAVRAILYFHLRKGDPLLVCDPVEYRFFAPADGIKFVGLKNAVLRPQNGFGYWAPSAPEWESIAFVPGPLSRFEDVAGAHPFAGVENIWYYDAVEAIAAAGITGGCSAAPPLYCPDAPVTREQMAVFLLRAQEEAAFVPGPCTTPTFADVPCSSPFAPWIQELVARGITAGCGGGNYCPGSPVTREQMAVFLVRAGKDPGFAPPACTTPAFTDVPCSSLFAAWVQQLVADGITAGCAPGRYCPTSGVTRAQMAIFLVRTFNTGS